MPTAIRAEFLQMTPEMTSALLPYAIIFLGACVGLVACTFRSFRPAALVPAITLGTVALAAAASARLLGEEPVLLFGRTLASDPFGQFLHLVFFASTAIVTLSSFRYLQRQNLHHPEYYVLILLSCLGMMLLVAAQELIVLFLGLELMSFSVYALVGFRRNDRRSNEAAVKYFVLGSAASAILLYGAALLYGATGTLQLRNLWDVTAAGRGTLVHALGAWLLVAGFLFKVAAVPFHMWMPDVYEGAPTPITAFMTTGVKVAAFGAFLRLFLAMEPGAAAQMPLFAGPLNGLLKATAIATILIGNLLAVVQTNTKRLLAYSSIAHTGYLLVGFVAASRGIEAAPSVLLYLVTYAVMTLGAFGVLTALSGPADSGLELNDLSGLASRKPGLAFALAIFLLSLAGLPPTAGFVAKYFVFYGAVQGGEIGLVLVAVLGSLISVYYYLRVLVHLYMKEPAVEIVGWPVSRGIIAAAAMLVLITLQIGLLPERWLQLMKLLHLS